jgi:hypothetical protein
VDRRIWLRFTDFLKFDGVGNICVSRALEFCIRITNLTKHHISSFNDFLGIGINRNDDANM